MSNNLNRDKKLQKLAHDNVEGDKAAKYTQAPYFQEKDRKAREFLKKHPVPEKFLQS